MNLSKTSRVTNHRERETNQFTGLFQDNRQKVAGDWSTGVAAKTSQTLEPSLAYSDDL